MLPTFRLLAVLIVMACLSASVAAEPVLLRYRFREGDIVRYAVQLRTDYTLQLGEKKEAPYTAQSSIKNYRVVSVGEDGSAQLELMLLEKVRAEKSENGQVDTYDSTQPDGPVPPFFNDMKAMVGRPHLKLTASPTGGVSDLEPLLGQPVAQMNEAAMDVLVRLPEEAVEIGGTWNDEFNVPITVAGQDALKKNIRLQRQYTLKSVDKAIATIEITNKILTPVTAPEEELQLIMRGSTQVIELDLERGLLLSQVTTHDKTVAGIQMGQGVISVKQMRVERLVDPARTAAAPAASAN